MTPIAHFHDTRGTGLVNYVAAYEAGVRALRPSSSGASAATRRRSNTARGFTGNVATEDLVSLFESLRDPSPGSTSGSWVDTARFCEESLGRELHGRVTRSGVHPLLAGAA